MKGKAVQIPLIILLIFAATLVGCAKTSVHPPLSINSRYAILLEIFYYPSGQAALETSPRLVAIHDFLIEQKVPQENIMVLSYTNATYENFQKAVNEVTAKADEDDLVFISLDGVGDVQGAFGFYQRNDTYDMVPYSELSKLLDKIKTKIVIEIIAQSSYQAQEPMKGENRVIITTCFSRFDNEFKKALGIQSNWFDYYEKYPDAYALNTALIQLDKDKNGYTSINEAFQYAKTLTTKMIEEDVKAGDITEEEVPNFLKIDMSNTELASRLYLTQT